MTEKSFLREWEEEPSAGCGGGFFFLEGYGIIGTRKTEGEEKNGEANRIYSDMGSN